MKLDRTLLDKDGVASREEIRAYHEKNDITTGGSLYDPETATDAQTKIFVKAQGFMRNAWLTEMKRLGGKSSFKNFTANYPPMLLAQTDGNLIAGKVSEILQNEEEISKYLDVGLQILEKPIEIALTAYATSSGKSLEELSDDEIHTVADKVATDFLNQMTATLMDAQKVPDLIKTSKEISDAEDFDESVIENYSKMDHEKAWNHTRSSVGEILSLDELTDDPESEFEPTAGIFDRVPESDESPTFSELLGSGYQYTIKQFLMTLDDEDYKIFVLRKRGYTQAEISERVGLANHSAVSKRLNKIRDQYNNFVKEHNNS